MEVENAQSEPHDNTTPTQAGTNDTGTIQSDLFSHVKPERFTLFFLEVQISEADCRENNVNPQAWAIFQSHLGRAFHGTLKPAMKKASHDMVLHGSNVDNILASAQNLVENTSGIDKVLVIALPDTINDEGVKEIQNFCDTQLGLQCNIVSINEVNKQYAALENDDTMPIASETALNIFTRALILPSDRDILPRTSKALHGKTLDIAKAARNKILRFTPFKKQPDLMANNASSPGIVPGIVLGVHVEELSRFQNPTGHRCLYLITITSIKTSTPKEIETWTAIFSTPIDPTLGSYALRTPLVTYILQQLPKEPLSRCVVYLTGTNISCLTNPDITNRFPHDLHTDLITHLAQKAPTRQTRLVTILMTNEPPGAPTSSSTIVLSAAPNPITYHNTANNDTLGLTTLGLSQTNLFQTLPYASMAPKSSRWVSIHNSTFAQRYTTSTRLMEEKTPPDVVVLAQRALERAKGRIRAFSRERRVNGLEGEGEEGQGVKFYVEMTPFYVLLACRVLEGTLYYL